jgi:isocitrate dehydrogenase kinase/phosphatase
MTQRTTNLALRGAEATRDAFDSYQARFKAITRRAKRRFEKQDWHGAQNDAVERLDLYKNVVNKITADIAGLLQDAIQDKTVWAAMKALYVALIAGRDDAALAETFFNSVTRRIFTTVGVDSNIEFTNPDFESPPARAPRRIYKTFAKNSSTCDLAKAILWAYRLRVDYHDLDQDAALVAAEIEKRLPPGWGSRKGDRIEMLNPVFYRNKGAYLIGRIRDGAGYIPLVLALLNTDRGLVVDAALLTEDEASVVFSFTRSYFQVEVKRPHELIAFLKSMMPLKRVAELYIAIGYHKHGKTELYRDLLHHLANSDDKFQLAPGDKGMVMAVFALPSYDVVFKVIKDRFSYPKTTTRQEVIDKYQLVFTHDRAGRLVDAQEFEYLKFDRRRFSPELLDELLATAANSVSVEGDSVVIKHVYTERRLIPLNLYLRDPEAAEAVVDYGQAIKDLAATNIFPGDLLLKNFGVTRHGRVVFYDYDELCLLTDCNFRELPQAGTQQEEFASEPWFFVGDDDIFPEEFLTFLGFPGKLREIFIRAHGDLLGVEFWATMQKRIRAGEVIDIFPYKHDKRLSRRMS